MNRSQDTEYEAMVYTAGGAMKRERDVEAM